MPQKTEWAFPLHLQPKPGDFQFDLDRALNSLVLLRAEIPEDAFTAPNLGTERVGNGVVIREDGIILTIGYLITEASEIWLTTNRGEVLPGYALASDQNSGFGIVQALGQLKAPVLARGSAASCRVGDPVLVAGHGGRTHAVRTKVIDRREFAGSWEYKGRCDIHLARAPQWGGAALIGQEGKLLGIGSLLVQENVGGKAVQGNMLVPIDLVEPILNDLLTLGRASGPVRPWLGMYVTEVSGRLEVAGMAARGPAQEASVKTGDVVLEVAGVKVSGMAELFRSIWSLGPAGPNRPPERKGTPTECWCARETGSIFKKPHLIDERHDGRLRYRVAVRRGGPGAREPVLRGPGLELLASGRRISLADATTVRLRPIVTSLPSPLVPAPRSRNRLGRRFRRAWRLPQSFRRTAKSSRARTAPYHRRYRLCLAQGHGAPAGPGTAAA
jgi:S1-C subfamily serine protease